MEQHFDSISDLLTSFFKQESTAVLPIDRIYNLCENSKNISVNVENEGEIPCPSIPKRKILFTLQNSDNFVQVTKHGKSSWALGFKGPVSISDTLLLNSIETMFTTNGPMTIHQLAQQTELPQVDPALFLRFLTIHCSDFNPLPDGTWWFCDQPVPERIEYRNMTDAIENALNQFTFHKARPEQIFRFLCLSTIDNQQITQADVVYHLTHNDDLYEQPERNVFQLHERIQPLPFHFGQRPPRRKSIPIEPNDTPFDPEAFFSRSTPFVFSVPLKN